MTETQLRAIIYDILWEVSEDSFHAAGASGWAFPDFDDKLEAIMKAVHDFNNGKGVTDE